MKLLVDFNDLIALVLLLLIIPGLWVVDGLHLVVLNGEVLGATITAWALVLQYYFRKRRGGD